MRHVYEIHPAPTLAPEMMEARVTTYDSSRHRHEECKGSFPR